MPDPLLAQFPVLEEALRAMGVMVWPMVYYEADDALASAAAKAARDDRVEQVLVCTPDKDLAQCVVGTPRRSIGPPARDLRDEAGVLEKWGVRPESIPDYLAVVGDSADGFPGLPGWGPKAAALTFSSILHFENVPEGLAPMASFDPRRSTSVLGFFLSAGRMRSLPDSGDSKAGCSGL